MTYEEQRAEIIRLKKYCAEGDQKISLLLEDNERLKNQIKEGALRQWAVEQAIAFSKSSNVKAALLDIAKPIMEFIKTGK